MEKNSENEEYRATILHAKSVQFDGLLYPRDCQGNVSKSSRSRRNESADCLDSQSDLIPIFSSIKGVCRRFLYIEVI